MGYLKLKTIDEDNDIKLLEQITINDRSLVATYDKKKKNFQMTIFHLTEKPTNMPIVESTWGFVRLFVDKMLTTKEAAEVVGLYMKDIENENYWWEK